MTRFKRLAFLVATLVFGTQCVVAGTEPDTKALHLNTDVAGTSTAVGGNKVAVVFTDIKLDDKLAIHVLLNSGRYKRIIAVISAVADQNGAHGDLLDFLPKMNPELPLVELQVLKVENVIKKPVAHELNFLGTPKPTLNYVDKIVEYTKHETVEIFQMAPTARAHIQNLIRLASDVTLYHLIHGYNTGGNEGGEKEKARFVSSIGAEIHQRFPNALVAFTNNWASFLNGEGSTQKYDNLLGRVPLEHLVSAANDPFHYLYFLKAMNSVEDAKLYVVADQLKRAAQLIQNWESISLTQEILNDSELPTHIMQAKKENPAKRNEYIKFVDVAMKQLRIAQDSLTIVPNERMEFIESAMKQLQNARDYLKNEGLISTPYMEYIEGRKPMKELVDVLKNRDWIAALDELKEVKEKKVFPSVSKKWMNHDESKTLAELIYTARKNEKGQETEDLRNVFLAFVEAVTPVVVKVRIDKTFVWERVIPKAFKATEMTVEVCDANHVVVLLEALTKPENLRSKLQDMIFVKSGDRLLFETENLNGEKPHGKTLTGLHGADSFNLLKKYLLKTDAEAAEDALRLSFPVESVPRRLK